MTKASEITGEISAIIDNTKILFGLNSKKTQTG